MLRFIKNCDALNFEFFIKTSFFKCFGYSDTYFGCCDIGGYSVTVNDILTGINTYSGDNSFSSGIFLLRYITVINTVSAEYITVEINMTIVIDL